MYTILLALAAAPIHAASPNFDEDGDGVRDRADECLALPERVNGYADEDGCPDYLASLVVRTRVERDQVPAEVEVRVGDRHLLAEAPVVVGDLVPGANAIVTAKRGCWVGAATQPILDGTNWVDVDLEARWNAPVALTVLDPDGVPVPMSSVEWDAEVSGCGPETFIMPADGVAHLTVGAGAHTLFVSAPGFAPVTEQIEAVAVRGTNVVIELAPDPIGPEPADIL